MFAPVKTACPPRLWLGRESEMPLTPLLGQSPLLLGTVGSSSLVPGSLPHFGREIFSWLPEKRYPGARLLRFPWLRKPVFLSPDAWQRLEVEVSVLGGNHEPQNF